MWSKVCFRMDWQDPVCHCSVGVRIGQSGQIEVVKVVKLKWSKWSNWSGQSGQIEVVQVVVSKWSSAGASAGRMHDCKQEVKH